MEGSNTALKGMTEISTYARMSPAKVRKAIQRGHFPARQIVGGEWFSDRKLIDEWMRKMILDGGI